MTAHRPTLADAAALLEPGMTAFIHGTATEPRALTDYLVAHPQHLAGVHVIASFIPGINTVSLAHKATNSHVTTFMAQPALAEAIAAGAVTVENRPYSKVPSFLEALPAIDIAFVHGRTRSDGTVSTSVAGELIPTVCRKAGRVCLLDDSLLPLPARGCDIDGGRIDDRFPLEQPLIEYATAARADAVTEAIAANVARLVRDGDTLQSGLGVIPGAVFAHCAQRRDLRIRSGMLSDSIMALAAAGALAGDVEHVYGMALGSNKLFDWLDQRDGFRVADVVDVHDAATLSAIDNVVAINSAIEVALDGSINAEFIGPRQVSGPGGLPDFATGAANSPNGRSIIALPAANARKGVSRIVARLANHDRPTVPAGVVTHVVTEHGVADLRDTDRAARAARLIAVADPAFRDELAAALRR